MARFYRPVIRDQEFLLPPNMADWLPKDHLVWFVLDVVDQLDTTRLTTAERVTRAIVRHAGAAPCADFFEEIGPEPSKAPLRNF